MKSILYPMFLSATLLLSCQGQNDAVKTIEPKEFAELITKETNPQILDVRTAEEFNSGHVDNALLLDWYESDAFVKKAATLDKTKPIYVYCMAGGRSKKAANKLHELGFKEVYDMKGGMVKWNNDGLNKADANAPRKGMTQDDYQKLIQSSDRVLVDFYAKWCAPCKQMAPYLNKMKEETSLGVKIIQIDADQNKELLKELNVSELPTFILFEKGKTTWTHKGFISEEDLRKQLK